MKIKFLTKNQKKQLLSRVAEVLSIELKDLKKSQKLTQKEIAFQTAVRENRLSEIIKHGKISEKTLSGVIGGEIVKVSDILKKVGPLTKLEKTYLESFYLYEDLELRDLLLMCREQKVDVKKALRNLLKK